MPLSHSGYRWRTSQPAAPTTITPPPNFKPVYGPSAQGNIPITAGVPFWKTEKFLSFIKGLQSQSATRIAGYSPTIRPLKGIKMLEPPSSEGRVPFRPMSIEETTERFPVAGTFRTGYLPGGLSPEYKAKIAAQLKSEKPINLIYDLENVADSHVPTRLVLAPNGEIVRTQEDIIALTGQGFEDLTPFTVRSGLSSERNDLINIALQKEWSYSKIKWALFVYDYVDHIENVPLFMVGNRIKNWASSPNPSIAQASVFGLYNLNIGLSELVRGGVNIVKPWRIDPQTGKVEFRVPKLYSFNIFRNDKNAQAYLDELERKRALASPKNAAELTEKIENFMIDWNENKEDKRRAMDGFRNIQQAYNAGAVASVASARRTSESMRKEYAKGTRNPIEDLKSDIGMLVDYFIEPGMEPTEEMKGQLITSADRLKAEARSYYDQIQSGKMVVPKNSLKELQDIQRTAANEGRTLSLAEIDKELYRLKSEGAPYLTTEQVAELQLKAMNAEMIANDQYMKSMVGSYAGVQMYSVSYRREPERWELFRRHLAEYTLQTGKWPNEDDIVRLKQLSENPWTEMAAEITTDISNLIDIDVVFNLIPALKVGSKVVLNTTLWKPLRFVAERTPIVKFFIREANSSVAVRLVDAISGTIAKILPAYKGSIAIFIDDVLPQIAKAFDSIKGATDETVLAVYKSVTDSTQATYVRGMENISYSEFIRLKDITSSTTGIEASKWKELYQIALDKAVRTIETRATDIVNMRQFRKLSSAEKAEHAVKVLAVAEKEGRIDSLANKLFAENFGAAFLESHRVTTGTGASKLLDDTVFGQFIQKLRFLGDQAANMPRAAAVEVLSGAQDLLKVEIGAIDGNVISSNFKKLVKGVSENKMSFGDYIDRWLITEGRNVGGVVGFRKLADFFESTHWILNKMFEAWTMSVLALNPRWWIQNFLDSSFRTIAYGGNLLEDLHMLKFATHKHLADAIGIIPPSIAQSLARNGLDETYSVATRILYEGWKPNAIFGGFSWWKFEYDRLAREGVKNWDDAPAGIRKMFEARIPKSKFGADVAAFNTGIRNAFLAIPGATSDFNTAIEFTIRLRMFSREYFKLYETLNPIVKAYGTEHLGTTVKTLANRIWDAAGGNSTAMTEMAKDIVNSLVGGGTVTSVERTSKSWSLLFNLDVDESLSALSPVDKHSFLADVHDKFNAMRAEVVKSGRDLNTKDINKFLDEIQASVNAEVTARLKKQNHTLGRNIDLTTNPDTVPPQPTFNLAAEFEGGSPEPPNRGTRNVSLQQMWRDAKKYFLPSVNVETRKAVELMRSVDYLPAQKAVETFTKAMSGIAEVTVSEVPGKAIHAWVDDAGLAHLELPQSILSSANKGEVKRVMTEGIAHALAARDAQLLTAAFPGLSETDARAVYLRDFIKYLDSAAEVAVNDTMSFYTISSQLHQDPALREMLERMHHKIDFENISTLKRTANLSYMELMEEGFRRADMAKLGDRMPAEVHRAGTALAQSSDQLWKELSRADGELREELAYFLSNSNLASSKFENYLAEGYPGYRKLRNRPRSDAAEARWQLMTASYKGRMTEQNLLLEEIRGNPIAALERLKKFNSDFATGYLQMSGLQNIVRTVDGGVSSFDVTLGNKIKTIRHTSALQGDWGLESYFYGEFNPFNRNPTVVLDATKFLDPNKSPHSQITDAFRTSFGLDVTKSRDVATIVHKRAMEIAERTGQSLDNVLRDRYGFAKVGRKLSAGEGVKLSVRNPLNAEAGRFTFYGSGENNIIGVMTQLSQMHYQDLLYLAKFGDATAVKDLQLITARISAVTKLDVALGGTLTDAQARVLADAYIEWLKNGVTEVHGLKGPLNRLSKFVAQTTEHLSTEFKRLDVNSMALMEKAFFSAKDYDVASSNSFIIRSVAKKSGLPSNARELLRMINNHPEVLGMTDTNKAKFVEGLVKLGRSEEEAEFTYDMFRMVSFTDNPANPGAWLAKHELIKGEELDLEAFMRASRATPMLFNGVPEPNIIDNMVGFMFRKLGRGDSPTQLSASLANMVLEAGSDVERGYIMLFIKQRDGDIYTQTADILRKHFKSQGMVDNILEQSGALVYDKRVAGTVYSTQSDEFRNWFKNSVTLKDGTPRILYAAPAKIGEDTKYGNNLANSLWVSDVANDLPIYASVQNPFVMDKVYTLEEVSDIFYTGMDGIDTELAARLKSKNLDRITGEDIWKAVRELPGVDADNADTFFARYGYDGLSTNDGNQFIPFERSQIKSVFNMGTWSGKTDDMLFQDMRGAFWTSNGRRHIAIWETADITTLPHEFAHSALADLAKVDDWRIRIVEEFTGIEKGKFADYQEAFNVRKQAETALKRTNISSKERDGLKVLVDRAEKYRIAHEKFANGMVEYLYTNQAPTPELKSVFEWFKQKLSQMWASIKDTFPGITPDMRKVYDSVLSPKVARIPNRRYSNLGEVPIEIAERVFGESAVVRMSNELNAAFDVYKQQPMFNGFSDADLKTFQGFKDVSLKRMEDADSLEIENVYRSILYTLEHFETEIGRHHLTDELLEFLQPKVRDYNIGPSTKTVLAHNLNNIHVKESIDQAIFAMRKDWTARVRGGGAVLPILTRTEGEELLAHITKSARLKSSMIEAAVNGGTVVNDAGKILASAEGALPKTNHILLDYTKKSNLDNFMKIFFPFWMFPSRSIPFWAEALVMHPWIANMYYKVKRMSETQRIQAGAVDSKGNPVSSLKGYIRIGTSDIWINPLAPFSFRYLLDLVTLLTTDTYSQPQSDEGNLVGLPYLAKEFLQTAPIIGFNVSPWWSYVFKKSMHIPDSVMPNWAITPQFGLLPKHFTRKFTDGIPQNLGPLQNFMTRWLWPEPYWQDSLIETRIREEAYQKAQDMTREEFDVYIRQVEKAILEKGDNPVWVKAFKDWSLDESGRSQLSFWTGIYPKTFNDGQADLIGLKQYNTLMTEAQNNNWVASAMGLPADNEARWRVRQNLRYGTADGVQTPESWLNRLYTETSWLTNSEGQIITDRAERGKAIATRMEEQELSRQAYFDAAQARQERDSALAAIPVGSPSDIIEAIKQKYYDDITKIYSRVPKHDFLSSKPVDLIEQDLRRDWWHLVNLTRPVWDGQPDTYTKYEEATNQWKVDLPSETYYLKTLMQQRINHYSGMMNPDQLAHFNKNIVLDFARETTQQGYENYRLENDSIYDAADEVYMRNYWDKYWDSLAELKGDARSFAEAAFQWNNPPPDAETIFRWMQPIYGDRFSLNQVKELAQEGEIFSFSIKERMNYNKTAEELMREDSYNLLMWAGPGTGRDALNKAYQSEGGGSEDFDAFYWSEGLGFPNAESLKLFHTRITAAAAKLNLQAPSGVEFTERMKVIELNEKFKSGINTELGYDFLRIENPEEGITAGLNQWYNGLDFDMQRDFQKSQDEKDRADWKRILEYRKARKDYAKLNPLWALYYYDYKKPKDLGISASFEGTKPTPGVIATEPGATAYVNQAPRATGGTGGFPSKGKRQEREDLGGIPPTPGRQLTKLSITQWPDGFRSAVGDSVANEIEGLLKHGRFLSQPAKQFLYDLAKRHRNWRGFIYSLLQR